MCIFTTTLITSVIEQEYPDPKEEIINIEDFKVNHVAKILSCEGNVYKKEFNSNILIQKFDNDICRIYVKKRPPGFYKKQKQKYR